MKIGSHILSSVPQRGGRGCAAPVGLHRAYISMSPPFFPWRFLRSDWILSCLSSLTAFHISVCKCLCRSLCGLKAMDTSCCCRRVPSLCLSETCCLLSFPLCLLSTVAHSPLTKSIMGDRDKSINNELRSCCVCTIWSSRVLVASRIAISSSLDTLSFI